MENPYELIYMSRLCDEYAQKALFNSYMPIVAGKVKEVISKLPAFEIYKDEMTGEGMMGLYEAIYTFREDCCTQFSTYVTLLVGRRVWSVARYYSSSRRFALHNAMSLEASTSGAVVLGDCLSGPSSLSDPEYYVHYRQAKEKLAEIMDTFTVREKRVASMWGKGMSYSDSAKELGVSKKSYDASLQRIRRKVRGGLLEED